MKKYNWVEFHMSRAEQALADAEAHLQSLQFRYAAANDSTMTPRERGARVNALAAKLRLIHSINLNWGAHPWAGDDLPNHDPVQRIN